MVPQKAVRTLKEQPNRKRVAEQRAPDHAAGPATQKASTEDGTNIGGQMPPMQGQQSRRSGGNETGFPERPRRSEASDARIQTTLEGEQENREEREPREPTTPQANPKDDRETNQQEPRNLLPH